MDNQNDGLWQGGPWEQLSPVFPTPPPVCIPAADRTRRPVLANGTGGLSGPALLPIAVRMVYEAAHAVKLPVIGMGGIFSTQDAIEMILAGADAVSVGTANFHNPAVTAEIAEGIESYMRTYGFTRVSDMVGLVE